MLNKGYPIPHQDKGDLGLTRVEKAYQTARQEITYVNKTYILKQNQYKKLIVAEDFWNEKLNKTL